MDFSDALRQLKSGSKVDRSGWNGKGMWITLIDERNEDGHRILAHVMMKTADGTFVPWVPSQADLMACDWTVYDPGQ